MSFYVFFLCFYSEVRAQKAFSTFCFNIYYMRSGEEKIRTKEKDPPAAAGPLNPGVGKGVAFVKTMRLCLRWKCTHTDDDDDVSDILYII